ncbi:unnamed protein product [Kuraishia capsulata CBS 1993]|uniref:Bud site selection protein 5 n=1 Tax=Kuraishia capsulata CBS 1993 TaxID=1382522 RepID=W6MY53_9ASCO|nr:uncharacterized protein KUCA_T00006030001 [Kuraishia capsulata CBS 1993]CDK30035.1 unnamed protein product [Kuraishia capsulata CBS 1993]
MAMDAFTFESKGTKVSDAKQRLLVSEQNIPESSPAISMDEFGFQSIKPLNVSERKSSNPLNTIYDDDKENHPGLLGDDNGDDEDDEEPIGAIKANNSPFPDDHQNNGFSESHKPSLPISESFQSSYTSENASFVTAMDPYGSADNLTEKAVIVETEEAVSTTADDSFGAADETMLTSSRDSSFHTVETDDFEEFNGLQRENSWEKDDEATPIVPQNEWTDATSGDEGDDEDDHNDEDEVTMPQVQESKNISSDRFNEVRLPMNAKPMRLNRAGKPSHISSVYASSVYSERNTITPKYITSFDHSGSPGESQLSEKIRMPDIIESASPIVPEGQGVYAPLPEEKEDDDDDDSDLSTLFVIATHAFDVQSLESEDDSSICLSFSKNDIAFTHALDESGWGEVTLLNTLKRGWVPMNHFRSAVFAESEDSSRLSMMVPLGPNAKLASSKRPLKPLFHTAAKFLLNPQNKPVKFNGTAEIKGRTFQPTYINGISDGVRILLQDTDCLSRTNAVVKSRPIIRKIRKNLLNDWYNLVVKAQQYRNTMDHTKIEILQLMIFQVLRKAIAFLEIWGLESDMVKSEPALASKPAASVSNLVYLKDAPFAMARLNEVQYHLSTYLALIMGRLDLVEHNKVGCKLLQTIVSHLVLLQSDFESIYTEARNRLPEGSTNMKVVVQLSDSLKMFGKMVQNLSIATDVLVKRTLAGRQANPTMEKTIPQNGNYFYTKEGAGVINVSSRMVSTVVHNSHMLKKLLDICKDFKLPESRKYPDFIRMKIEPEAFIRKCSMGLLEDPNVSNQMKAHQKETDKKRNRQSKRFSMFRSGMSTSMAITAEGLDHLSEYLPPLEKSSPFIAGSGEFEQFMSNDSNAPTADSNYSAIKDELLYDSNGALLGASFKGLVHLLTDEGNPPDYFFTSAFFLTFRIFSNGSDLLEELVGRFDVSNKNVDQQRKLGLEDATGKFSSFESRIRNRRKLVCNTFQLWLESYWKPKTDYILLATLINFFNEGIRDFLPIETIKLIEACAKLIGQPPVESAQDRLNYYNNIDSGAQLVSRKISPQLQEKAVNGSSKRRSSFSMHRSSFTSDFDNYDLENVSSDDDSSSSLSLGLPSGIGNSSKTGKSLLNKRQMDSIEIVNQSYRNMLGDHWKSSTQRDRYVALQTDELVKLWWKISRESWKILNQDLVLLNFNSLEIAKQLTLIESNMFCSIKVEELLNQNFTASKLHLNLSPNIHRSILFTNALSDYVLETVLHPNLTMRQRIHALKCWLKVSLSCLYLRNFNSLAAIMTSLQSFMISRITKIWTDLTPKYMELFEFLTSIIHPDRNYSVYRAKLKEFLSANVTLDVPIVPYLSLFLQDLTFIVDGNSNYRNATTFLSQKLINIDKYFKITRIISDLETLQISYSDIYGDVARKQSLSRRLSFFSNNRRNSTRFEEDNFEIAPVYGLQELVLLEVWKVKQINAKEDDRPWKLSCNIQPREE